LDRAREGWRGYSPNPERARVLAVDSGWNHKLFTGFYVYAIKAAAVDEAMNLHHPIVEVDVLSGDPYDANLTPDLHLKYQAEMREHEIAHKASKEADLVLVDGSIIARLADVSRRISQRLQIEYMAYAKPLMGIDRLAFVSKYSQDRSLFNGILGDAYYINCATRGVGYTRPYITERDGREFSIFYVRLSEHSNALHVEVPAAVDEDYVRWFMDVLHETAIAGYPYTLRVAHRVASLPDRLMESLCKAAGLTGWVGAREVLEA